MGIFFHKQNIEVFIKAMQERDGITEDFDESLLGCMVEHITVGRNKGMTLTFRNGMKIQAWWTIWRRALALRIFI